MIRMLDAGSDWESVYRADGTAGWNSKGLSLIDWGSSIDVLSFPEDQKFMKLVSTGDSSIECWQVRNQKAWTYEIDWYGCASVIHVLLFGTYMSVMEQEGSETPHLELKSHFKRYWNSNLWKDTFDLLLNAGTYNTELLQKTVSESITVEDSLLGPGTDFEVLEQEFPLIQKIHDKRIEMELWLKTCCCSGGKSLRNLLRRVEIALLDN
jgi:checkpoint serine/threonine-protein kinase